MNLRGLAFSLAIATGSLGALGCGLRGSGDLVDETYDVEDFERLRVSSGLELEIEYDAEAFEVVVTIDDNLVEYVEVELSGDLLEIRLERFGLSPTAYQASIRMATLRSLELSGGSNGHFEGFEALDDLDVDLSGGSRLSAASGPEVEGRLRGQLSGGSRLNLSRVPVDDADLHLSGGSRAQVRISDGGSLVVDASGGSTVEYCGDDVDVERSTSGGSRVSRDDC